MLFNFGERLVKDRTRTANSFVLSKVLVLDDAALVCIQNIVLAARKFDEVATGYGLLWVFLLCTMCTSYTMCILVVSCTPTVFVPAIATMCTSCSMFIKF